MQARAHPFRPPTADEMMGRPALAVRWTLPSLDLNAPVGIFDSHNIVLAKVAADLNLDEFERNPSGIGQAMNAANWDIHRFILM